MTSIPTYFVVLTGLSLYIIGHQQGHVGQVVQGYARLSRSILLLISGVGAIGLFALLGLVAYFWVKLGWIVALKFAGLALLVQFAIGIAISGLSLLKYAWAISLSGIVLIPLFLGIMIHSIITT